MASYPRVCQWQTGSGIGRLVPCGAHFFCLFCLLTLHHIPHGIYAAPLPAEADALPRPSSSALSDSQGAAMRSSLLLLPGHAIPTSVGGNVSSPPSTPCTCLGFPGGPKHWGLSAPNRTLLSPSPLSLWFSSAGQVLREGKARESNLRMRAHTQFGSHKETRTPQLPTRGPGYPLTSLSLACQELTRAWGKLSI